MFLVEGNPAGWNRRPTWLSSPVRMVVAQQEIQLFVLQGFQACASALAMEPIKVPSGKYEEKLKVERTQADIINEMSQELGNLPRFSAFAKIIEEKDGHQVVSKQKIKTIEMPPPYEGIRVGIIALIERDTKVNYCKKRTDIETEIGARQQKWRGVVSEEPPPAGNKEQPSFPVAPSVIELEEAPPTSFLLPDKDS